MEASSLRIGNKVYRKPHKVWIPFTVRDGEIGEHYANGCSPIPLTEEILLKCGGEKTERANVIIADRFQLNWLEAYKYWYVSDSETVRYITKVEFVHEWQNVFWSLNGQELEVSL